MRKIEAEKAEENKNKPVEFNSLNEQEEESKRMDQSLDSSKL